MPVSSAIGASSGSIRLLLGCINLASKRRRRKAAKEQHAITTILEKIDTYKNVLAVIVLFLIIILGVYIRLLPAINYSLELDANDPWIAYWIAKYFHENGLTKFSGLTHVTDFWWPYGRNFLRTEYLGTAWLAAATYPIGEALGFTLREWVALAPVAAGGLGILLIFLLVYYITGSRLGGLASAALFAFSPGAIIRTSAGFVEKIGIAIPIVALSYLLAIKASRSRDWKSVAWSFAAGAVGGLVAWFWGGYNLVITTYALAIMIDPVFRKPDVERLIKLHVPLVLGLILLTLSSPAITLKYFTKSIGVILPGALLLYGIALTLPRVFGVYNRLLYTWILAVTVVAGVLVATSGMLSVSSRLLAAIGIRNLSPLVESVQEHAPASWSSIMQSYGVPLLLGLAGLVYLVYYILSAIRKGAQLSFDSVIIVSIYALFALLVYMNKNMVYFEQMASFYAVLASGIFIGLVMKGGTAEAGKPPAKRKQRPARGETGLRDQLKATFAFTITVIVLLGSVVYAQTSYERNAVHAPSIMTSMLGEVTVNVSGTIERVAPLNKAWINALRYINESTPKDALIVSWWDYGYWITVNTGRKTVADGATLNETQIMILARILTGTEDEASGLLPLFKAKPGGTYVVFYDVFTGIIDKNGTLLVLPQASTYTSPVNKRVVYILHGAGDLAKSFQMLKIGRRIDPHAKTPFNLSWYSTAIEYRGVTYYHFPGFVGEPAQTAEKVRNALLYKLTIYGLYHLLDNPIMDEGCTVLENVGRVTPAILATRDQPAVLPPVNLTRFTLEAVSIGCPPELVKQRGEYTTVTMILVFIYKWIG